MHAFEFVLSILFLVFAYKLIQGAMSRRAWVPPEDPEKAVMLQRLEQLEERVRVLERIVTDERFELKQQFKDLETS